jgi:hypothetical protein
MEEFLRRILHKLRIDASTTGIRNVLKRLIFLAEVVVLSITGLSTAKASVHVQFCWAIGSFDNTAYFAEAEGREDRSISFGDLLEISGIDHREVRCSIFLDQRSHQMFRKQIIQRWLDHELEVVDTTYMSDLDY